MSAYSRVIGSLLLLLFLSAGCTSTRVSLEEASPAVSGPWTLVNFGADWCPVCKKLEPELTRLEKQQPNIRYLHVDIEAKHSPEFKTYFSKYFRGRAIPLTVLVAPDGKPAKDWTGYLSAEELVSDILSIESSTTKEPKP